MTTNEYTAHLAPASSQECRKCKTAVDLKEVHETTYKIVFTFTLSFVLSLLIKKKFLKKLRLENDSQFVHLKDYPLEAGNNRKTSIPTRKWPSGLKWQNIVLKGSINTHERSRPVAL